MAIPKEYERYSWKDYLSWNEDERWELSEGIAWAMSPAPTRSHQKILTEMGRQFANYLLDKTCEVYVAPFDVKLSVEEADDAPTVFQPDVVVCCDPEKLTENGISGAPDLVIEVISPSTGKRDRKEKFEVYQKFGVNEYWIVEPDSGVLEIFRLENSKYERIGAFGAEDKAAPAALPELEIDLSLVFKEK